MFAQRPKPSAVFHASKQVKKSAFCIAGTTARRRLRCTMTAIRNHHTAQIIPLNRTLVQNAAKGRNAQSHLFCINDERLSKMGNLLNAHSNKQHNILACSTCSRPIGSKSLFRFNSLISALGKVAKLTKHDASIAACNHRSGPKTLHDPEPGSNS